MSSSVSPRRSFLARLAAGTAAIGAVPMLAAIGCAPESAPASTAPTGDELDTWFAAMKAPNKVLYDTPYGYNDAMCAKYPQFASLLKVEDPTTKKPAARNIPLHDDCANSSGRSRRRSTRSEGGFAYTFAG